MKKYKKIKYLGKGSYGAALLVSLRSNANKQFVIKEIVIGHMKPSEQQTAKNEAEVLHHMNHSNITMYIESFVENSKLYIVMEYADGGDLSGAIKRQKEKKINFSEDEIMRIFVQICLAIKHVHTANILHRDLKSQNIFLTSQGIVKLGDFGIAKVLNASLDKANTQIGTPYYLSPEICESLPYDQKSDIWSLGVILYELCALELPFQAHSLPALVHRICTTDPSYKIIESQYSESLLSIMKSCLNRSPDNRPTIKDLVKLPYIKSHICELLSYTLNNQNSITGVTSTGGVTESSNKAEDSILTEDMTGQSQSTSSISNPISNKSSKYNDENIETGNESDVNKPLEIQKRERDISRQIAREQADRIQAERKEKIRQFKLDMMKKKEKIINASPNTSTSTTTTSTTTTSTATATVSGTKNIRSTHIDDNSPNHESYNHKKNNTSNTNSNNNNNTSNRNNHVDDINNEFNNLLDDDDGDDNNDNTTDISNNNIPIEVRTNMKDDRFQTNHIKSNIRNSSNNPSKSKYIMDPNNVDSDIYGENDSTLRVNRSHMRGNEVNNTLMSYDRPKRVTESKHDLYTNDEHYREHHIMNNHRIVGESVTNIPTEYSHASRRKEDNTVQVHVHVHPAYLPASAVRASQQSLYGSIDNMSIYDSQYMSIYDDDDGGNDTTTQSSLYINSPPISSPYNINRNDDIEYTLSAYPSKLSSSKVGVSHNHGSYDHSNIHVTHTDGKISNHDNHGNTTTNSKVLSNQEKMNENNSIITNDYESFARKEYLRNRAAAQAFKMKANAILYSSPPPTSTSSSGSNAMTGATTHQVITSRNRQPISSSTTSTTSATSLSSSQSKQSMKDHTVYTPTTIIRAKNRPISYDTSSSTSSSSSSPFAIDSDHMNPYADYHQNKNKYRTTNTATASVSAVVTDTANVNKSAICNQSDESFMSPSNKDQIKALSYYQPSLQPLQQSSQQSSAALRSSPYTSQKPYIDNDNRSPIRHPYDKLPSSSSIYISNKNNNTHINDIHTNIHSQGQGYNGDISPEERIAYLKEEKEKERIRVLAEKELQLKQAYEANMKARKDFAQRRQQQQQQEAAMVYDINMNDTSTATSTTTTAIEDTNTNSNTNSYHSKEMKSSSSSSSSSSMSVMREEKANRKVESHHSDHMSEYPSESVISNGYRKKWDQPVDIQSIRDHRGQLSDSAEAKLTNSSIIIIGSKQVSGLEPIMENSRENTLRSMDSCQEKTIKLNHENIDMNQRILSLSPKYKNSISKSDENKLDDEMKDNESKDVSIDPMDMITVKEENAILLKLETNDIMKQKIRQKAKEAFQKRRLQQLEKLQTKTVTKLNEGTTSTSFENEVSTSNTSIKNVKTSLDNIEEKETDIKSPIILTRDKSKHQLNEVLNKVASAVKIVTTTIENHRTPKVDRVNASFSYADLSDDMDVDKALSDWFNHSKQESITHTKVKINHNEPELKESYDNDDAKHGDDHDLVVIEKPVNGDDNEIKGLQCILAQELMSEENET